MTILTDSKRQTKQSDGAATAVSQPVPTPSPSADKPNRAAGKRPFPGLHEMSLDQLNDLLFG